MKVETRFLKVKIFKLQYVHIRCTEVGHHYKSWTTISLAYSIIVESASAEYLK